MKKLLVSLAIITTFAICFAGTYTSTTTSNTAEKFRTGPCLVDMVSVFNPGRDTLCIYLYDALTPPTATTPATFPPFLCPPGTQIFGSFGTPFLQVKNNGYIRTTKKPTNPASISVVLTTTVSPTFEPRIDIHY